MCWKRSEVGTSEGAEARTTALCRLDATVRGTRSGFVLESHTVYCVVLRGEWKI